MVINISWWNRYRHCRQLCYENGYEAITLISIDTNKIIIREVSTVCDEVYSMSELTEITLDEFKENVEEHKWIYHIVSEFFKRDPVIPIIETASEMIEKIDEIGEAYKGLETQLFQKSERHSPLGFQKETPNGLVLKFLETSFLETTYNIAYVSETADFNVLARLILRKIK